MPINFNPTVEAVPFWRRGSFWLSLTAVLVGGAAVAIGDVIVRSAGCGCAGLAVAVYVLTHRGE